MTKVKICGITNVEDAIASCEYGADLLGFIFVKETPRYVDAEIVKGITSSLSGEIIKVGLFRDEQIEEVTRIVSCCRLNHVQLHGAEEPDYCAQLKEILRKQYESEIKIIKSFKVKDKILCREPYDLSDYADADYFVFDTFHPEVSGGTGLKFDWKILDSEREKIEKPFFIAGGLKPDNVEHVVNTLHPYGVDVSSGVENVPGRKDRNLLKEFIQNAKNT